MHSQRHPQNEVSATKPAARVLLALSITLMVCSMLAHVAAIHLDHAGEGAVQAWAAGRPCDAIC
jgi:hypothetical protein